VRTGPTRRLLSYGCTLSAIVVVAYVAVVAWRRGGYQAPGAQPDMAQRSCWQSVDGKRVHKEQVRRPLRPLLKGRTSVALP
jgi:hypothetical protein